MERWLQDRVYSIYRESGDTTSWPLTDHFMVPYRYTIADTRPYRTDAFTTIIGAELHTGRTELGHLWHIAAMGLPLRFCTELARMKLDPRSQRRQLKAGAFVAAPHPAWYGLTESDVVSLGEIHAIEVYNATSCDYNDRPDSVYMLDLMLMRGRRYSACATDDAHFKEERYDALRGWVQVKSEHNQPEALVDALKLGSYYASTGPKIHDIAIGSDGDKLSVNCSPAERIFLTGYGSKAVHVHGHGIHCAEFSVKAFKNSPFIRVTVRDSRGGRAWSNPIWL